MGPGGPRRAWAPWAPWSRVEGRPENEGGRGPHAQGVDPGESPGPKLVTLEGCDTQGETPRLGHTATGKGASEHPAPRPPIAAAQTRAGEAPVPRTPRPRSGNYTGGEP